MHNKKIASLLALLLCMSLMMTGCGSSQSTGSSTESAGTQTPSAETASAAQMAGELAGYRTEYIPLQDGALTATPANAAAVGETIYFTALGVIGDNTPEGVTPEWPEQYWEYGPVLLKVALDGSAERVPYVPESVFDGEAADAEEETANPAGEAAVNRGTTFERLLAAEDGTLWLAERHYLTRAAQGDSAQSDTADGTYSEERYRLVHLTQAGEVLAVFPLDELTTHAAEVQGQNGTYSFSVSGLARDAGGRIYLAVSESYSGTGTYGSDDRVCILNPETGAIEAGIPLLAEAMITTPDGRVAVSSFQGASYCIAAIDQDTQELTDTVFIRDSINALVPGTEQYPICYSAGNSFYGLESDSWESVRLLNWVDVDVARSAYGGETICILSDGRIVTVSGKETASGMQVNLILLTPAAAGELPERKTLRLAVLNLYPFTSEMVSLFNRTNTEYRIEVTDYSEFNDYTTGNEEDQNAGINRLQTEIIAGNVPDLLDLSLLSTERMGSKGILEDLYPYIDADPELDRSMLLENVLSAFEENGKLYQTVGNFYVLTAGGLTDVVGDRAGWTMKEFNAALSMLREENPGATAFGRGMTRDTVLTFLLYLEMENFVDWSTGECRFDSEEFITFLEFVKSFPTYFDYEAEDAGLMFDDDLRMRMGLQLLKECSFVRFEDVQTNTAGLSGEEITFIGYPTENGVGSMFAQIGNSIAITSTCANKEAAWEFVRLFFLPEYQEQFGGYVFPTNRAVYEAVKQDAMTTRYERNPDGSFLLDRDGKRVEAERGQTVINGETYQFRTVTEEEIAILEEVIASTKSILHVDSSLEDIITSGAAPYFADQRSVEEVARLIQSKANLYVNEQR